MTEFIKMDIFFFVTTLAVVFLTGIVVFILWRVARILRYVEHISKQIALESDAIRHDLAGVHSDIQKGKGRLQSVFNFFGTRMKRASHNKK